MHRIVMHSVAILVLCCNLFSDTTTAWLLTASCANEIWTIETFAGTGVQGFEGDGGPAKKAMLDNPFGVIRGPDGAIWFCEYTGQRIRRIDANGMITTIAGNGKKGFTGDGGPAIEATFNLPHEIRFDKAGDLFVVDMMNHVVRKIEMKTGVIRTVAGTGQSGFSGDGDLATKAQLKQPHSIQFGPEGDLWICDIGNHVIRRVHTPTGVISTFAGTGIPGATPDGSAIAGTPLKGPRSMDFDRDGNLWLATREGNQLFRFNMKNQSISHLAGTGGKGFSSKNGPAKQLTLNGPKGVAVDKEGNAWLVDSESSTIWRYRSDTGMLERMAGTGEKGDGPDGDPLDCRLARPHGIFVDADGSVFIGDSESHRIRVLRRHRTTNERYRVQLVAGGERDQVNIPAAQSRLREPFGTSFDGEGSLWIVEMASGNRLLKIDSNGNLQHMAGQNKAGFSGDHGNGLSAQFNGPHNIAMHPQGMILIADTWNGRIRQFDPIRNLVSSLAGYEVSLESAKKSGPYCVTVSFDGREVFVADLLRVFAVDLETHTIRNVAGNGEKGVPKDGAMAVASPLVDPRAAAPDRLGNVYILERNGHALRVVEPTGKIRTVVNALGKKGNSGDGGPALAATMNGPKHLAIDTWNRVVIADAENHLVRRYDPATGVIERIAGTGEKGASGIGKSSWECQLARPHGVAFHPTTGELYITDSYNDRILRLVSDKEFTP
jgi:DNA-binding beta-propeller fold protein YncE